MVHPDISEIVSKVENAVKAKGSNDRSDFTFWISPFRLENLIINYKCSYGSRQGGYKARIVDAHGN